MIQHCISSSGGWSSLSHPEAIQTVHVRFMKIKVAVGQVSLWELQLPLSTIIPTCLTSPITIPEGCDMFNHLACYYTCPEFGHLGRVTVKKLTFIQLPWWKWNCFHFWEITADWYFSYLTTFFKLQNLYSVRWDGEVVSR
jgi:hypothetical protein